MRGERVPAWLRAHSYAVDAALAGGAGVVFAVASLSASLQLSLIFLVEFGGLAWRRVRPVASAAAVCAAASAGWLVIVASGGDLTAAALPGSVGVLAAVYSIAARRPRWAAGVLAVLLGSRS